MAVKKSGNPCPRDEAPLLTFSEKELKAVLLEEFDWQRAMVKDLVQRLKRRKPHEDS